MAFLWELLLLLLMNKLSLIHLWLSSDKLAWIIKLIVVLVILVTL
jgi:hypothetical protein